MHIHTHTLELFSFHDHLHLPHRKNSTTTTTTIDNNVVVEAPILLLISDAEDRIGGTVGEDVGTSVTGDRVGCSVFIGVGTATGRGVGAEVVEVGEGGG